RTPAKEDATRCAATRAASMSRPSTGRIWIVASRAICDCHVEAVSRTSVTAPRVRQERNVMIAMTRISAWPATLPAGTSGACRRCERAAGSLRRAGAPSSVEGSIMDFQPSARQHHAPRVDLLHQAKIVGGDHHGGAEAVQLDEQ